ncbi:FAD-dependent oxidoreductase [Litorilinea aerophila]|uniref:Flavoprotein oxidoreductase n=1 Tax=Litorilinea aerophila TaxID=1204385 RepID=A0A540VAS5_9CHLR|nr:FAD-dependent oxidoreductase [Litorilinea aerophila]MCC9078255.1 FAD-dependent oxidoreductase [Litorilinea aerophila]
MSSSTMVIIGGDAAGMSAASKIRRECPDTHVIVFEKGEHISYSACGMPYWIGGVVDSDRRLLVLTVDAARKRRGIDVRTHHEVVAIDPVRREVTVRQLGDGTSFQQPYDLLLIATGASPARPPIPGLDLPGVFTLRSLSHAQQIYHFLESRQPRRAVIIGGGYIGLEMAEAFRDRELEVTVVEMLPQILPNFDPEMVEEVAAHVQQQGVTIHTGTRVTAIQQDNPGLAVVTEEAGTLPADLVLVATGVRPNGELARQAGLRMGQTGAIWVDDHMRTSDEHIYAAGDCVEHYHLVLEENAWIPLATSANKGGRVAGENMAGGDARFPGILGTAVVKVFDYTVAVTGVTEQAARASGKFGEQGEWVGSAVITNDDKAGYWPGAEPLKVKLVFDRRDGRVLGGQLAGKAGVNKRIDIVATAITARMTVADVGMLDLSYAPPYSHPYDPVQICANVALRDVGR